VGADLSLCVKIPGLQTESLYTTNIDKLNLSDIYKEEQNECDPEIEQKVKQIIVDELASTK